MNVQRDPRSMPGPENWFTGHVTGDIVNVGGGEWHWHGAAPDQAMTHPSLTEGDTEWGDHVTDTECEGG